MPLSSLLSRSYQHLTRYQHILAVLFKYGFDDIISSMELEKYLSVYKVIFSKQRYENITRLSRWERIRMVFEELGPTFIKLGQLLSNRPDIIPEELIKELEKLQDNAPTFPGEEARKIIETALKKPVNELFHEFEEQAFASASMAQVHKALLPNGEKVVIKVLRPGIQDVIATDLDIMLSLAHLMERYVKDAALIDPVGIVKAFEKSIKKELDFNYEALNLERFRRNNHKELSIYAPKFFKQYSSENILTMELIEGYKVTDTEAYTSIGIDPQRVAEVGVDSFFKQVFIDGFFHADPHAGNLIVMKTGKLCFIDFGMMGHILPDNKEALGSIFIGIETKDPRRIVTALKLLSNKQEFEHEELLEHRILEFIDYYSMVALNDLKLSDFFSKLRDIIVEFRVHVPADFFLLAKAITTTEGLGRKLYPEINIIEHLKPFVAKLIKRKLSPLYLLKKLYLSALDLGSFIQEFPSDIREIISKIKQGTIKVEIEHKGLDELNHTLDRVSNRIAFAIMTGAMIIGSSLIVHSKIPPFYKDIPVLGLIGFLLSIVFALWLVISIIRRGKI